MTAKKCAKVRTWMAPLAAIIVAVATLITVGINTYTVQHQLKIEKLDRAQEHEKWNRDFQTQIRLSETNRQRDFAIWQARLSEQRTNWMTERNIEWAKQQEIWRQQRAEEWTQQIASVQAQEKTQNLSEKERMYGDFIFYVTKMGKLMNRRAADDWHLYCLSEDDFVIFDKKLTQEDKKSIRDGLHEQTLLFQRKVQEDQAAVDDVEVIVDRLMQSIAMTFSTALEKPIHVARAELLRLPAGIPNNPEIDAFIHTTFRNDTNAWYTLTAYFQTNLIKHGSFENFYKSWNLVDQMMWRELRLDQNGIPVKPEYLFTSDPIQGTNGLALLFTEDDPEKLRFEVDSKNGTKLATTNVVKNF